MVPISIKDLNICFDTLELSVNAKVTDSTVTISHPRFREDGHKLGITFQKIPYGIKHFTWELLTPVRIINEYIKGD